MKSISLKQIIKILVVVGLLAILALAAILAYKRFVTNEKDQPEVPEETSQEISTEPVSDIHFDGAEKILADGSLSDADKFNQLTTAATTKWGFEKYSEAYGYYQAALKATTDPNEIEDTKYAMYKLANEWGDESAKQATKEALGEERITEGDPVVGPVAMRLGVGC